MRESIELRLLISLLFETLCLCVKQSTEFATTVLTTIEYQLSSHPGGKYIADLLAEHDAEWGNPLESAGLELGRLIRARKS